MKPGPEKDVPLTVWREADLTDDPAEAAALAGLYQVKLNFTVGLVVAREFDRGEGPWPGPRADGSREGHRRAVVTGVECSRYALLPDARRAATREEIARTGRDGTARTPTVVFYQAPEDVRAIAADLDPLADRYAGVHSFTRLSQAGGGAFARWLTGVFLSSSALTPHERWLFGLAAP